MTPSNDSMELTVAIPTFNRNDLLLRHLTKLLPQLSSRCRLLILDNCSPTPVEETLREELKKYPDLDCRIVRNTANIGANANILRCLELCDTHWIWIIGDDDDVKGDAIDIILRTVDAQPDCLLFNFSWDKQRTNKFVTYGLKEFVEKMDGSTNLPWISHEVWACEALRPNLKFGYQYTYSMLPHVVTLLMSIGERGGCCFLPEQLMSFEPRSHPVEQQWSWINLALGYPTVFDLPLDPDIREGLVQKLMKTNDGGGIALVRIVLQLLLLSMKGHDKRSIFYFYDQICSRGYYFDSTLKRRAQVLFFRILLQTPRLSYRMIALAYRLLKGRRLGAADGEKLQDRSTRM